MYWWRIKYYTMFPFTETKLVLGRVENDVTDRFMKQVNCDRDKIIETINIGRTEELQSS